MMKKYIAILGILFTSLMACEEYEPYMNNYKYSAVYFATQKPLRTIVAYDEMQFKVGVALAGKRENSTEEWVTYEIDESLLTDVDIVGGNTFTLLPDEYYELSNTEKMIVPKGEFIGDVTVTLDKELFTSDPLAHLNTYALPLRLIETSTDSILGYGGDVGTSVTEIKDYTVLVVKYISPLHGVYYHKGVERELDGAGAVVSETIYSNRDLSKNETWSLSTIGLDSVVTSGAGTSNQKLKLKVNSDNTLTIEPGGSGITITEGAGTYNEQEREFYLDYTYTNKGKEFEVIDTLILRQPPEKDLRFEEW